MTDIRTNLDLIRIYAVSGKILRNFFAECCERRVTNVFVESERRKRFQREQGERLCYRISAKQPKYRELIIALDNGDENGTFNSAVHPAELIQIAEDRTSLQTSPRISLAIRPITRSPGGLKVNDQGKLFHLDALNRREVNSTAKDPLLVTNYRSRARILTG